MNLKKLTKEQLLEQADVLELEIEDSATNSQIIALIQSALGEDQDDEPKADGIVKPETVQIRFANDAKNKQPVFVGNAGRSYRFPRGIWVDCPKHLLPIIENAKKQIQDETTKEWMEVESYPYSTKG